MDEKTQIMSAEKRALLAKRRRESSETEVHEPIAVVGLACRFPGAADPDAYFDLLLRGTDVITEVPRERFDVDAFYDPDPSAPGKMISRWGGFLEGVDRFDPSFFGISPREAPRIDPQQRLLLELGYEALVSAGLRADQLRGSATGVFVGICQSDYADRQFVDLDAIDGWAGAGSALSMAANRLSFTFDFCGPSLAIDTACSSSLVSVHLAVESLRKGECRLALAGGVNLLLSPNPTLTFSKAGMMAADGRCKTFDAAADGYVRGEGAGLVVLRRLSDALAARDRILAVIRGSAINQDGRTNVLTAPSGPAQERVIQRALTDAGLPPERIGLVECHGTGTTLGDPIEVEALRNVFGGPRDHPLWISAVKSTIGHLEGAAGIAGLIKVVLALSRKTIPPQANFRRLSPNIDLTGASIQIPTRAEPFDNGNERRAAGVSSFGFGGTNAHVILEEAPPVPEPTLADRPGRAELILVSGHDAAALRARGAQIAAALRRDGAVRAWSAQSLVRMDRLEHRWAVVGTTGAELIEKLEAAPGAARELGMTDGHGPIVVFDGQAAQWPGMGRELFDAEPVFATAVREVDDAVRAAGAPSVIEALYGPDAGALLTRTDRAQPAVFALELGLWALSRAYGTKPLAMMGHSLGEITAAAASGHLSLGDAVTVLLARAELMQTRSGVGRMIALGLPRAEVEARLAPFAGRVVVAADNGPDQVVVAGETAALAAFVATLGGVRSKDLGIADAFHSPVLTPIVAAFRERIRRVHAKPGNVPLLSTVRGTWARVEDLDADHWVANLIAPVEHRAAIQEALRAGARDFVELGPQPVLERSIRATAAPTPVFVSAPLRRGRPCDRTFLEHVGALFERGFRLEVDAAALFGPVPVRPLLPYPFSKRRFFLDAELPASRSAARARAGRLLGSRLETALSATVFDGELHPDRPRFLGEHRIAGTNPVPFVAFVEMMLEAQSELGHRAPRVLSDLSIGAPLLLEPDTSTRVQLIATPSDEGLRLAVFAQKAGGGWERHAEAREGHADDPIRAPAVPPSRDRLSPDAARAHYEAMRGLGYEQAPGLLNIVALASAGGRAEADVALGDLGDERSAYLAHPALLEAVFAVAGAAAAPLSDLYLPAALSRFVLFAPLPAKVRVVATVQRGSEARPKTLEAEIFVYGEGDQLLARVDRLVLIRTEASALSRAREPTAWRYEWVAPERLSRFEPRGRLMVLSDDETERSGVLAALRDRFPSLEALPIDRAQELERELGSESLRGVIYAAGLSIERTSTPSRVERHEELLSAMQALLRGTAPAQLYVFTRGAHDPRGRGPVSAEAGLGLGLFRALALEAPSRVGTAWDLPFDRSEADRAIADLAVDGTLELSWSEGTWRAQRLARAALSSAASPVRADRGYLITGGSGTVGTAMLRLLIERGAKRIALLQRSEPSPALRAEVEGHNARGASIRWVQGDVADPIAVERAVESLLPLGGVVHSAGALEDAPIVRIDLDRHRSGLSAKVDGALALHNATKDLTPDFFLLCSSMAAQLGSPGQASYGAANAFLDGLARERRRQGLVATSLQLGPLAGSGMAARLSAERARFASAGFFPIDPPAAARAILGAAASPDPVVPLFAADLEILSAAYAAAEGRAISLKNGKPTAPAAPEPQRGSLFLELEGLDADARRDRLRQALRERIGRALGAEDPQEISLQRGFFQLGLDSLMAVDITRALERELGRNLPASLVFDHPTIETLSLHLCQTLFGDPGPSAAATAEASTNSADRLLLEIEAASSESARALLEAYTEATSGDSDPDPRKKP